MFIKNVLKNIVNKYSKSIHTKKDLLTGLKYIIHNSEFKKELNKELKNKFKNKYIDYSKIDLRGHVDRY